MKKSISLIALLFLSVGFMVGQNSKVTTGQINVQNGDYENGVKNLKIGLKDHSILKAKVLPKGYFYLGRGYLGLLAKARQEKNVELIAKYPNALMDAFEAFKAAKETDDGKWGSKVDAELMRLFPQFLATGNELLAQSYKVKGDQQITMIKEAKKYLSAAVEMNSESYMAHDLLGQSLMSEKDSTAAMKSFQTSIKLFGTNPPARPDLFIAYTYYRIALLNRHQGNNLDKALVTLDKGKKVLESEYDKLKKAKASYSPEDWTKVEDQYNNAKKDLEAFELDIYLISPDKLEEALTKFEKAVVAEPDNYTIHVAYASLLEKSDEEKAVKTYQRAIEIKPDEEHAYFNLGALYNNMAKVKYDIANDEKDYEKADKLQKEVDEIFKLALPNFEKCFEINPNSLTTVRALKQITIRLSMMEDYEKYKEAEKALKDG